MTRLADYEFVIAGVTLAALLVAQYLGVWIGARLRPADDGIKTHLSRVVGVGLTILVLLLGFSFSVAIHRYDLRKAYEEEEANAISSEYALAGVLPDEDAIRVRGLLRQFVRLRIDYFESNDPNELIAIRQERYRLEAQMWPIVVRNAKANQTSVIGQALAGMNTVVGRASYSQAAALDRFPFAVWTVLFTLGVLCCGLNGYAARGTRSFLFHLLLPLFLSISFYVIATLDSQRHGVVRVLPVNLIRVEREIS